MFRTVPLSIIRSMCICNTACEQDQNGTTIPSWSCSQAVSKPVWHIPLLYVQCKTPDDGQRNCPKHVEYYSKNKFEKLVHLVGFSIRIYHDSRSPERHYITMYGHLNVTISRCTVTWTSLYHDARSPERHYITMHGHLNVTLSRCPVTWPSNTDRLAARSLVASKQSRNADRRLLYRCGAFWFLNGRESASALCRHQITCTSSRSHVTAGFQMLNSVTRCTAVRDSYSFCSFLLHNILRRMCKCKCKCNWSWRR